MFDGSLYTNKGGVKVPHKKRWVTITILAATFVLLAGVIGGVAYAQTGNTQIVTDPGKTFIAKVAAILGIDQKKVEDAFIQAQKQVMDEELASRLKALVDQGRLTQQQADQYKQWLQSRPNLPAGPDFGPRWQSGPNLPAGPDFGPGKAFRGGPRGIYGPGVIPPVLPPTTTPKSN